MYSPEFAGEQIPTLQETLDLCEELDLLLFLELKSGSTDKVMEQPTILLLYAYFSVYVCTGVACCGAVVSREASSQGQSVCDIILALATLQGLLRESGRIPEHVVHVNITHCSQKVRRMDPNIMCGLTLRSRVLQYRLTGEPRNQELWKHVLAGLVDRLMFWSTHTWLWKLLGISLLLPHKDDILKKK